MMPLLVDRGFANPVIVKRTKDLVARVGVAKVAENLATNMSGGQQQRFVIARSPGT